METRVGMMADKGRGREEEEEREGLDLGFGFGFASSHQHHNQHHPQKMIRTDTLPFRMVAPSTAEATSTATFAAATGSSPTSPHPFPPPPSANNYNSNSGGGPTVFYNNGVHDFHDAPRTLQPFSSAFKSPGMGGAATPQRYPPFTAAQWQELQRQALIYKYIMASTPVPHELLFSSRAFPDASPLYPNLSGGGGYFNLRFSSNTTDPEPGRCRRTDGKKWRCSRDVAPDQKYCERHLHRGRPRSRKLVEHHKINATAATSPGTSADTNHTTAATATLSNLAPKLCPLPSPALFPKPDLKLPFQFMVPPDRETSNLDWMKGDTEEMGATQQWQLMHSKMGLRNPTPVLPRYEDDFNLNYTDLNGQCCPFLNPDISSLNEVTASDRREPPRRFIDAWSRENLSITTTNDDNNVNSRSSSSMSSVSSVGQLSPSNLTLSMSGGGREEDPDQIQMGLSISDPAKSQPLSWNTPVSPFGGPLGEVLRSSAVVSPHPHPHHGCDGGDVVVKGSCPGLVSLMSKSCCGSEGASPRDSPTRLVSSPSGVLQKTLVSLSDSSSNSSPTFAAVPSRSEIALQWMSQSK